MAKKQLKLEEVMSIYLNFTHERELINEDIEIYADLEDLAVEDIENRSKTLGLLFTQKILKIYDCMEALKDSVLARDFMASLQEQREETYKEWTILEATLESLKKPVGKDDSQVITADDHREENLTAKDFNSLSDDEKFNRLYFMAKSSKKLCHKIVSLVTDSNGNTLALSPSYADWMENEDDYLDLVAESYIEIRKIIEKTPKMSLGKAVYSAVWNSLRRMYRNEIKSVSALAIAEESEEDEEKYTFDLESFEAPEHFSTEKTAEFSVLLEEICHDDRDMYIISMKLDGYTDAEIGESIGVSRQSVEKRFKNIKARYYSEYRMTDNELRRAIENSDIQLCEIREKYIEFSEKWEKKFTKDWTNITKFLSR